ncbi:AraC family transcriptional regulator [Alkalimarinus coralli]|uniref:AraC family transcriptional regulator n=1 Tax=Alkalimarinus coralli TaxID=2935863 RepID=UPI00202ADE4B|nr:helix-turn-helix domain-containing protein [Alkalimarinus coralli]
MNIPKVEFHSHQSENIGIEVIWLNDLYSRATPSDHNPSLPHRVEFHCFIYITKGEGVHFIDFNHYPVQAGSCIFVNKHQVQAFDFTNRPEGYLILFTDEFVDVIRTNIRTPLFLPTQLVASYLPTVILTNRVKRSCESLLLEVNNEQARSVTDPLVMQLLFAALLLKINREKPNRYTENLSEPRIKKFLQFMQLVEVRHCKTRDASDYANAMHMTYKSLNEICKLASGQTAKQLIDAHTILEAKRKLIVENLQVQTLAYSLGFDEVTNFVKYFKKHTLLTPSQFKASYKG